MSFITNTQLPSPLVKLCQANLSSHVSFMSEVLDICERDKAFGHIVEKTFHISLNNNLEENFKDLNFNDFRNQIALCYLSYIKFGNYFRLNDVKNELDMILDLEKKFSTFVEGQNSSFFLLLLHIKVSNMVSEEKEFYSFGDIHKILEEADVAASSNLDWLVVLIQSLIDVFKGDSLDRIKKANGDFSQLASMLDPEAKRVLIAKHLSYGYAINDYNYFLYNKV